jgi:hypothetical protein
MFHQGKRFVLSKNTHDVNAGIRNVAEREIDDPVDRAERKGGLRTLADKHIQPGAYTSGQQHGNGVLSHRSVLPAASRCLVIFAPENIAVLAPISVPSVT